VDRCCGELRQAAGARGCESRRRRVIPSEWNEVRSLRSTRLVPARDHGLRDRPYADRRHDHDARLAQHEASEKLARQPSIIAHRRCPLAESRSGGEGRSRP